MIPNNNQEILSMLAEKLRKKNRGRNMVLLCAVAVGIVTLTLISELLPERSRQSIRKRYAGQVQQHQQYWKMRQKTSTGRSAP